MSYTKITAVLIDTVSIQQYIFSSNKLKENLGGSYIIEDVIYREILFGLLKEKYKGFSNYTKLENEEKRQAQANKIAIIDDTYCDCEIGYIGGGNALVFFKDDAKLTRTTQFIQAYTKEVLVKYPGLKSAFGIKKDFDFKQFAAEKAILFDNLLANKSAFAPQTIIPKHGITADCPLSNEAAEFANPDDPQQLISGVSKARLLASRDAREKDRLKLKYPFLGSKFTLTDEFENLGQGKEKGYIAVVHIDGNSMGKRFKDIDNLPATRRLSDAVNKATEEASNNFGKYVSGLVNDNALSAEQGFSLKTDGHKTILPYRPIITGGDDITFVCDGRLGIHFAEKFIKELTKNQIAGHDYHACAGVALVKTKYPFYRAVKLAEELCAEAKKPTRNVNGSYLDFYISSSGFSGTLEHIRSTNYNAVQGSLSFGPYQIKGTGDSDKHIDKLKENIQFFSQKWPRNKVMEFREVLFEDVSAFSYFQKQIATGKCNLPNNYSGKYHNAAFENRTTPYYDIINVLDFYPQNLLAL